MNLLMNTAFVMLAFSFVLVVLLWRRSEVVRREEERREALQGRAPAHDDTLLEGRAGSAEASWWSADARSAPLAGQERVVALVNGEDAATGFSAGAADRDLMGSSSQAMTREQARIAALEREVRDLRLTVVELTLEKARLASRLHPAASAPTAKT